MKFMVLIYNDPELLGALPEREFDETFRHGDGSACVHHASGPRHDPGKHVYLAILLSMFLHGGFAHLFGNMLFLWVFGNNVEDQRGWWRYLLLYVVGGLVATWVA